ncbi:MAG: hypothetical protein KDA58_11000, partial [Planctomycetaceae bacterium]|nr:hypothetical protein [Planctomycetaceae bacterium]
MTVAPKSDAAPLGSYLLWALLTLLGLWLGSLAAAEVPASWKRLLLFPAACGLLGGWLAGTLWHRLQCGRPSRIHLLVTGQLLLLALANITLVNYQQHLAQTPQLNQALLMLEGISQSSPELQAETQRQKAELTPSFPKYLRYRVSHLAD